MAYTLAQMAERTRSKGKVRGSIPRCVTKIGNGSAIRTFAGVKWGRSGMVIAKEFHTINRGDTALAPNGETVSRLAGWFKFRSSPYDIFTPGMPYHLHVLPLSF